MRRIFAVIALAILAACGTNPATQQDDPEVTVFALQSSYNVAGRIFGTYKNWPTCGSTGATQACSQPDIVASGKLADAAAYDALMAAQKAVRTPGGTNASASIAAARSAIDSLVKFTATLPKKP